MMLQLVQLSELPTRRGVSKYRGKIMGSNAYLATTSERRLLHGAIYVASAEMPDAALVVWLNEELLRIDPVKPRHLQVVPRTVTPAIDGPSLSHPEILARVEIARRSQPDGDEVTAADVEKILAMYDVGTTMHDVCERLSRSLGLIA